MDDQNEALICLMAATIYAGGVAAPPDSDRGLNIREAVSAALSIQNVARTELRAAQGGT